MKNYRYSREKFCVSKGKYVDEMHITVDSRKRYIWLRHEMDGHGMYTNNYHIYSKVSLTNEMEFRPRNDNIGDLYYIKLNREEVIKLLGEEAVDF